MPLISTGEKAPDFTLPSTDGKPVPLKEVLQKSPATLLVFYKDTCPTCQFTLPYIEKIYKSYKDKGLAVVGIEQDDAQRAGAFSKQYGLTFPALIDQNNYKVSYAYGIDTVPTMILVEKDVKVSAVSVGFVKDELAALSKQISTLLGAEPTEIFKPGEYVPAIKPG
ncbi:MAG: TlpA family protein disulfide reductase [candidate division Zixibacteria bacterium]|nr:TlpA family protein disulfide reductase [candidate division Zixibacteria bacterium]